MAYSRDTFVGGSSVLSITMYEMQVWDYYHTYIQVEKIERIEKPLVMSAWGSMIGKIRGKIKMSSIIAEPSKPRKSAMELFSRGKYLKKKGSK